MYMVFMYSNFYQLDLQENKPKKPMLHKQIYNETSAKTRLKNIPPLI